MCQVLAPAAVEVLTAASFAALLSLISSAHCESSIQKEIIRGQAKVTVYHVPLSLRAGSDYAYLALHSATIFGIVGQQERENP
jgi:hypothetical protein